MQAADCRKSTLREWDCPVNGCAAVKHGGAALEKTLKARYFLGASAFFFCSAASFWRRSASVDLITSIWAPFYNSSALGTLIISLVTLLGSGGATCGFTVSKSTSKISAEWGGIFGGEPFCP